MQIKQGKLYCVTLLRKDRQQIIIHHFVGLNEDMKNIVCDDQFLLQLYLRANCDSYGRQFIGDLPMTFLVKVCDIVVIFT